MTLQILSKANSTRAVRAPTHEDNGTDAPEEILFAPEVLYHPIASRQETWVR